MTKIKFTNLYKLVPEKKKTISKIVSLIKNSKFVGGDEVKKFEENFSKYIESLLSMGSGLANDCQ